MNKSKYGDALSSIVNDKTGLPNTGGMTQNSPTPPTPAGGITIASELLPNVKVGDIITLTVQKVDTKMGEIHLVRTNEQAVATAGTSAPTENLPVG